MRKKMLFIILCSTIHVYAQNNSVSSGGQGTSSQGSVSYSVGQVFFNAAAGSNGFVIQGNQQPFEISVITSVRNINIELNAQVYPNPVAEQLLLSIRNDQLKHLSYVLTDIQGKIFRQEVINNVFTNIEMSPYENGVYIINVLQKKRIIRTFKIIKNK